MQITVIDGASQWNVTVDPSLVQQAQSFFAKLDSDMANGWQLGRDWLESPTQEQRCQIIADRLVTALEGNNEALTSMMAAYLLHNIPALAEVEIGDEGESSLTRFILAESKQ